MATVPVPWASPWPCPAQSRPRSRLRSQSRSDSTSDSRRPRRQKRRSLFLSALLFGLPFASAYSAISNTTLDLVASNLVLSHFDIHNGALLAPLLQPRVPGTKGHEAVEAHLASYFYKLNAESELGHSQPHSRARDTSSDGSTAEDDHDNSTTTAAIKTSSSTALHNAVAASIKWRIEWQNSTSTTPLHKKTKIPFRNLILTLDPPGVPEGDVSRLVLSAHYDSKVEPKGFIGAIDSAAPCAMLMHVARQSGDALRRKWAAEILRAVEKEKEKEGKKEERESANHGSTPPQALPVRADDVLSQYLSLPQSGSHRSAQARGLQIIFLDGEEAFVQWTAEDSVYGARALAREWESKLHAAQSKFKNPLASIELFVLLDLLGAKDPSIPSYFPTTHWAYRRLSDLEGRMRDAGLFESSTSSSSSSPTTWFRDSAATGPVIASAPPIFIGDDHTPFLARGVEILHLIPAPFPAVWHRMEDDGAHLDMPSVRDWARLVTAFVAEWMGLGEGELWTGEAGE